MTRSNRSTGFTLLEVLVVLAILTFLAALLLPTFGRVRDNARRSACQSNLKQIGLALAQYVGDYAGHYPCDNAVRDGASANGWALLIQPYAKSTQFLQCPSEETAATVAPTGTDYSDYGMNRCLLGLHEAVLSSSANTVVALDCVRADSASWDNGTDGSSFDCRGDSSVRGATPGAATWLSRPDEPSLLRYAERHLQGGNYLLADGHVKYARPLAIANNCTAPNFNITFAYK